MAHYSFWYNETSTMKGFFYAESLEEATELLRQANDGEIMFEDLPEFYDKCKGQDIQIDVDTLEAY